MGPRCFNCNGISHYSRNCPLNRRNNRGPDLIDPHREVVGFSKRRKKWERVIICASMINLRLCTCLQAIFSHKCLNLASSTQERWLNKHALPFKIPWSTDHNLWLTRTHIYDLKTSGPKCLEKPRSICLETGRNHFFIDELHPKDHMTAKKK